MARSLDPVEQEYEEAMRYARSDEEAYELSIGLRQYRDVPAFASRGLAAEEQ